MFCNSATNDYDYGYSYIELANNTMNHEEKL